MLLNTFISNNFVGAGAGGGDTVTIDTSAQSTKDASSGIHSPRTASITVASNTNRALFVTTPLGDPTTSTRVVDSVTSSVDGAFTQVASAYADDGDWDGVDWWYLVNPTVGAHTVTVNFADISTAINSGAALVISLYGVNQSSPVGTPSITATKVSSTGTASVTLSTGDMALGGVASDAAATLTFTAGTERQKQNNAPTSGPDNSYGLATNTGNGSISITFTSSENGYAFSVIPVKHS